MHDVNPFRFGVQLKSAVDAAEWSRLLLRVEDAGYDFVSLPDHLDGQLSPVAALSYGAGVARDLHFATLVLNMDLRHPLMVLRDALTLSLVSEGRFELGVGAGWDPTDYSALGVAMAPPHERVRRFGEALELLRLGFDGGPMNFEGEFYRVVDAVVPHQEAPRPKLIIGGGGKAVLRLACTYGDIVGINPRLSSPELSPELVGELTAEVFGEKARFVQEMTGALGRSVELQCRSEFVYVGSDHKEVVGAAAQHYGIDTASVYTMPPVLVGEVEGVIDQLLDRRSLYGVSNWVIHQDSVESFAPVVEGLRGA